MGADCCSGDPTQDKINTETADNRGSNEGNTETDNQENSYEPPQTKPATKESIPDDSYLKSPSNGNEPEESLLVPSTLSAVDDIRDPPPPSDYEDNDEYALKTDNNNNNYSDNDNDNDDDNDNENNNNDYVPDVQQQQNDHKNGYDAESSGGDKEENEMDKKPEEPKEEEQDEEEEEEEEQEVAYKQKEESPPKPKHRQVIILENEDLKERSVKLVTGDNKEFIKFLKKILKSKLNEKIWSKCDPNNTQKIETDKFMYFWTLPVTLFKVAVYQRKHGNKQKPKLDQKELKKEFTHLATWIIRRYGEKQQDGGSTFTLTKENFAKDIVEYVTKYAEVKGELYEEY